MGQMREIIELKKEISLPSTQTLNGIKNCLMLEEEEEVEKWPSDSLNSMKKF